MAIFETFSKKQKRLANQGNAEVYQYLNLPNSFRVQVHHIWTRSIGKYGFSGSSYSPRPLPPSNKVWDGIHETLRTEQGVFELAPTGTYQYYNSFSGCQFQLLNGSTDEALDVISLSFAWIDRAVRQYDNYQREQSGITQGAQSAIDELNHRFREHAIGYQFTDGQLVRNDSLYLHSEVVIPAIQLLRARGLKE